ncbi:putative integrase [Colletotrichum incanum]|nr:putative integrase [Colletotrichum incanum]
MASKLSAPVNNATFHAITKQDPHIKIKPAEPASQFSLEGSYGTATFPGVLPDNGYLRIFNSRPTSDIRTGTDNVRPRSQCHENRQTENVMKQRDLRVPVIHKWGHPLMLLQQEQSVAQCIPLRLSLADYIAVSATRQLPAFFAFSTGLGMRLTRAFSTIANVCEHCQLHAGQPKRFRFTLRNDHESNHEVLVWIIYLDGNGPVLHVVDSVTGFNAARFLKVLSAQHTWDALRMCWIVVYQGSHDFIPTDAGIDFRSRVFKRAARTLAIIVKAVPIEAHHDIGKVERYHATLRRAYDIICAEDHSISRERFLQMTVKTINDTAGPNGLISTLLVFSAPSPGVAKRAEAVQKTTDELRRTNLAVYTPTAKSLMPSPSATARSDVFAWRENYGTVGPYKLLSLEAENFTLDLLADPRSSPPPGQPRRNSQRRISTAKTVGVKSTLVVNFASDVDDDVVAAFFSAHGVLLTNKDCADLKLATQLQKSGKITTPGRPFEQSDKVAVKGLIDQDILGMVMYDPVEHANVRISQSRMVEMKGKNTNEPHEKSRLVIQVYLDNGKEVI